MALYPGSFDPITNGHLDLIQRGSALFDRLIVAILRNDEKHPLFSVDERMEMVKEVIGHLPNVEVGSFGGLLVDYAAQSNASVILRGIRAVSDYEYELQMALDESPAAARRRNRFPDGERSVLLHQLAPGEGSNPVGREHRRSRAALNRG